VPAPLLRLLGGAHQIPGVVRDGVVKDTQHLRDFSGCLVSTNQTLEAEYIERANEGALVLSPALAYAYLRFSNICLTASASSRTLGAVGPRTIGIFQRSTMNRCAVRAAFACLSSIVMASTTGCLRVAPKMPRVLVSAAPLNYSSTAFDADVSSYRASVAAGNLDTAKTQRNQIIFHIMAQIDAAYGGFELNLSMSRAGAQTSGDAAQLGLTAAATVVGASGVKDILSATSTALQGTRLSFDKNFFEQKTTESLISQMRASRKTLQAQVLLSLATRDVNGYPLEAAWIDVVNYYYAGTIPSALVDIASKAGNDAVIADQNLKAVVKQLTLATPAQAQQAVTIRSEYEQLNKAISSADPASVKSAVETLAKIFTAAKIPFDSTAPPSTLLDTLKQAIIAAADDDAKLQALNAAVKSVSHP
jgi:hypothetical protein